MLQLQRVAGAVLPLQRVAGAALQLQHVAGAALQLQLVAGAVLQLQRVAGAVLQLQRVAGAALQLQRVAGVALQWLGAGIQFSGWGPVFSSVQWPVFSSEAKGCVTTTGSLLLQMVITQPEATVLNMLSTIVKLTA